MGTIRASYKTYKKTVRNPVSIQMYVKICYLYSKFLISKVMDGFEITLPARMGTLCVVGKEQKVKRNDKGELIGFAPDWVGTKALWESNPEAKKSKKILYHMNFHTNNVRYRFLWSKKNILVANKTLFSLRLTRENKRTLHKKIMGGVNYKNINV